MIVDPVIAALRSDSASQRRLRAEMDAAHAEWHNCPEVAQIFRDLVRFAEGQSLDQLTDLRHLMTSLCRGRAFVEHWLVGFVEALQRSLLAQLPFQHHHSNGLSTMQLATAGRAALSLSVYAEREHHITAQSAVFADRETHDLVLFGKGGAKFHQRHTDIGGSEIETAQISLSAGSVMSCMGDQQSRQIDRVSVRLVVLQLSRVPSSPAVSREYALRTGNLLLQSSGDKRASQQEMAMAVLSAMRRSDAAPVLAEIAKADGADHVRWEAVRHGLALDAGEGLRALCQIANATDDPLAAPAHQLIEQLRAAYPQLFHQEAA